jgi:hypothetical protein
MGVDGTQVLQVRGPASVLDAMEACHLIIQGDERISLIANRFFLKAEMIRREPKFLVVTYEYRNMPVYEYLEALLREFPQCWMKNEFSTDQGICGVWIGRMIDGEPALQEQAWTELGYDELIYGEDFSE